MTATTLQHLAAMIGCDTQNPPRAITIQSDIFQYLKAQLPGFQCSFLDAGHGSISLLAKRGNPKLLFNFHIDTVPVAPGWSKDPFDVVIEGDKVYGLGACDIKGAAACMLSAVNQQEGDVALLFSSDEEHGTSAAIRQFLTTEHGFEQVIVAEPTQAKAALAHRGLISARVGFEGCSGHASEARAITDNAIHKAGLWIGQSLQWVAKQDGQFEHLQGLPFNIGKIGGGIKGNMIAGDCELAINFRPLPGECGQVLCAELVELTDSKPTLNCGFEGPSLPAGNQSLEASLDKAQTLAEQCGIPVGPAVNFWTEASLFSQAGLTAFVYGPGDIAQAHTADEWVDVKQLQKVEATYLAILKTQEKRAKGTVT